jgi:DNA-binding transcriptional MerR regulator
MSLQLEPRSVSQLEPSELAEESAVPIETIRYYQSIGLLPPPTRSGRKALYSRAHLERLTKIKELRSKGWSLKAISAFLEDDRHKDQKSYSRALRGNYSLLELSQITAVPTEILDALVQDGVLKPKDVDGKTFSEIDVALAKNSLSLLSFGLPLTEVLRLAKSYHSAVEELAEAAAELFAKEIREPILSKNGADAAGRVVETYEAVFSNAVELVTLHFEKELALASFRLLERIGTDAELTIVKESIEREDEVGANE